MCAVYCPVLIEHVMACSLKFVRVNEIGLRRVYVCVSSMTAYDYECHVYVMHVI